jgi:hypothetical protein
LKITKYIGNICFVAEKIPHTEACVNAAPTAFAGGIVGPHPGLTGLLVVLPDQLVGGIVDIGGPVAVQRFRYNIAVAVVVIPRGVGITDGVSCLAVVTAEDS